MKRTLIVFALVAAAFSATSTPANASTWAWHGDRVEYWYTSDKPVNNITYYNANEQLVRANNVRFAPMLFNLGGPPMYQTSRYITVRPRGQVVGSGIRSNGRIAQCKVYVNQSVVDSDYSRGRGPNFARC